MTKGPSRYAIICQLTAPIQNAKVTKKLATMPQVKTTADQFARMLGSHETQVLEFKRETKASIDTIAEYSTGFYNARKGDAQLVIGVTDDLPQRKVIGTELFQDTGRVAHEVYQKTEVPIDIEAYPHEDGRVLIVHVPESASSHVARFKGRYLIRRGSSLVDMTPAELAARLAPKGEHDYSAQLTEATFGDLHSGMVASYASECAKKAKTHIGNPEQHLHNIDLLVEGRATIAAVILFGTDEAVRRWIPVSELTYIYSADRGDPRKASYRQDYRTGMWGYLDELWELVNARNSGQSYQHKFARHSIPTFDEAPIREAMANAIMHRDYTLSGSIHVHQFQYSIEISSPGGFVQGVAPENILHNSQRRNELLAQAFQHAERAERYGWGVPMMFDRAMELCKPLPDFSRSDSGRVRLELDGELVHTKLAEHMRHTPNMENYDLTLEQYQALCAIALGNPVEDHLKDARKQLLKDGIIKSRGTGKATAYFLAVDSYRPPELFNGEKETVLAVLSEVVDSGQDGISFAQLDQAISEKSEKQIRRVANAMKRDGLIRIKGKGKNSRWVATDKGSNTHDAAG